MLPLNSMSPETLNYYEILDIAPDANQELIYQAYRQAQQTYALSNPEIYKVFSQQEALAWMDLVEEAYSVIGSPNARRTYDQEQKPMSEQNLPSFELQNPTSMNANPPGLANTADDDLPEGHQRTKAGHYKVRPEVEDIIAKQELFDGLFLKKVREYKCIELTDFSKLTCIAIRHLFAIENNNFSVLPAAVFVRGYIIQYCRILSLDEKKVVPSFMSLLQNDN